MRAAVVAVAVLLAGCGSSFRAEEVRRCEEAQLAKLKTPGTYKLISSSTVRIDDAKRRYQSVQVSYDAQNEFGALIRTNAVCVYPVEGQEVRADLVDQGGGDLGDALAGHGVFSPRAKLMSKAQRAAQLEAEVNAIINRVDAEQASGTASTSATEADNLEVGAEDDVQTTPPNGWGD